MRAVGIDIGSFSIKVAELDGNLKSPNLRDFFELQLTHTPGQNTKLEIIEALKRIVAQYNSANYKIVVGLGSEFSAHRTLSFPFKERRKILQSLPFELEDVIPFSQTDAIFDFRSIVQKANSTQVLAVSVPKKAIQERLNLCDDAGLDPDIVSLEGIALSNLTCDWIYNTEIVEEPHNVETPAQLVIHIGYSKTIINAIANKQLVASRALYFGAKDIAAHISRTYQLPYLEALKGLAEKGFVLTSADGADQDQVFFSKTVETSLQVLINDTQRTIAELRAAQNLNFTEGFLMGGLSRLLNLGPYLGQHLNFPFSVKQHLGVITSSTIPAEESIDKGGAVAIGLALEALRTPKNPAVNLRRNEFSKQSKRFHILWEQYKDVVKFGAALFVAFLVYSSMRITFIQDNLALVEQGLKTQAKNPGLSLSSSQLKTSALKKFIKAKRDEIESKKEVQRLAYMTSALDIVKNLSQAAPAKGQITLDIKHLLVDGEKIELQGSVNSKAEYDLLQQKLALAPNVSRVAGNVTEPAPGSTKVSFSMSMNVTRLEPKDKRSR